MSDDQPPGQVNLALANEVVRIVAETTGRGASRSRAFVDGDVVVCVLENGMTKSERALIDAGVIPDHRPPDIVRMAPVALYTRFEDCREAVDRLKAVMERRAYESIPVERGLIT